MMKVEIFMTIPDFENYKVSTYGKVINKKRNKELKPQLHSGGYYHYVNLCKQNKRTKFFIHRLVVKTFLNEDIMKKEIDHIDGNPKNNSLQNLRVCSHQENLYNSGKSKNNTSGFKGISFHKSRNKWRACMNINKKHKHLGHFDTKEAAYEAYKEAAKKFHGEFCYQNL